MPILQTSQEEAYEIIKRSKYTFLTGKAGTGKSFLTTQYIQELKDQNQHPIVCAPTGVAALNIGGTTIHSTFKMFGPYPDPAARPYRRQKVKWMRINTLIIDEVSMVSPDYLDYIDDLLRQERGSDKPFGGLQVLLVGDPKQLPPVHTTFTEKDQAIMNLLHLKYGEDLTFDKAKVFSEFVTVELTEVKRQSDPKLIELLNKVREGDLSVLPEFNSGFGNEHTVHLRHTNKMVDKFNDNRMNLLQGKSRVYTAIVNGLFDVGRSITPAILTLKEKARVMITANLNDLGLVNGEFGTVVRFEDEGVVITVDRFPDKEFTIGMNTWQQIEYEGWEENVIGTFSQIPLKLGWCMTIHKSQGLTLDSLSVAISKDMPVDMIYVALSRARSFENLFVNLV